MNAWILLVFGSQLIQALVILIDKFLVSEKQIKYPIVYAFYASVMSGFVFMLMPFFNISMPDLTLLSLSLGSSITFVVAIWSLYTIFKQSSTLETMPMVTAISAILTIILSVFVFDTDITTNFFIGSAFLVVGSFLIARYATSHIGIFLVILSGASFAVSTVLLKEVFLYTNFVDGFFWSRTTNVIAGFLLLLIPGAWRAVRDRNKNIGRNMETAGLVVLNKVLAGVGFLMFMTALNQGNPGVVNAMQGLQFAFLFMFVAFFSEHIPEYFRHEIERRGVKRDIVAIFLIIIGVGFLFV